MDSCHLHTSIETCANHKQVINVHPHSGRDPTKRTLRRKKSELIFALYLIKNIPPVILIQNLGV